MNDTIRIFVDLDNTLFDTDQLDRNNAKQVAERLHIEEDVYWNAGSQVFKRNKDVYSFSLHAQIIVELSGLESQTVQDLFHKMFSNENSPQYVFPGTFEFLDSCRKIGRTTILTLGEDENQSRRAKESGLADHVHDVVVTQSDKGDTIRKCSQNEYFKIVMLDDSERHLKSVERIFPEALTLHLVRSPEKKTESERHVRVSSYGEALDKIAKFANE